jgi:TolB-like protein
MSSTAPRGPLLDQEPTFVHGEVVAERYRVERFIAFGGMGEVYEAEDTALKSRVALKTLRLDLSHDARILERFKRELLLARRITHVNVCRLFDLGVHHGTKDVTFFTMELLDGDTLAHRLRETGKLSTGEALPLIRQMIAALDAAHQEGIIHRDFKSGNVMLVGSDTSGARRASSGSQPSQPSQPSSPSSQTRMRVVVTDFGLARGGAGDPFATNVTGDRLAMMGSPAYMAPEQVAGEETTVASDVYSLGVVIFEMVTGRVPFDGDSAMSVAVKRLKQAPPEPRSLVPHLDERWNATILRCLAREPAERFATVADVGAALEAPPAPRRRAWPVVALAVAAAAAAAVAVAVGGWVLLRRGGDAPAVRESRPTVAMLGFRNVSGRDDVAWLGTALGEMMTTELGASGGLRPIAGESVARMKRDLKLEDTDTYAPDTLARIQKHVGADYVLVGSFVILGDKVRVDVRVQSARGETLAQAGDTAEEKDLAALVARLGAKLREGLAIGTTPEGELALVNAAMPKNPDAAREYAEGLARARLFDMRPAREHLERALAIEPGFPQAYAALGDALSYMGYDESAEAAYKKAYELSGGLAREDRLWIEGRYYDAARAFPRAKKTYEELYALAPDNPEYGMQLASVQFSAGEFDEGMKTIARVKQIPHIADDPRLHLVLVQAALGRQDYVTVLSEAEALAQAGQARGALGLIGDARHSQAVALWFEGDFDAALERADEARQVAFTLGDRDGVAGTSTTRGFIEQELGRHAAAKRSAEEGLQVATEVGSRRRIPAAHHVLARAALGRGDLEESRSQYEQSAVAAKELGSVYWEALGQLGVAAVLGLEGRLAEAEPIYDKLIVGFRLVAPKHNMSYLLYFLGELRLAQGDLRRARQALAEALATRTAIGEKVEAERTRLILADVELADGKPADAEAAAQVALDKAVAWRLREEEAFAAAAVARARAAQGNVAGADAAAEQAERAAAGTESRRAKLVATRARGYVLLAKKDRSAERVLADGAAAAEDAKFASLALDMRLGAAEAAIAAGQNVNGRLDAIAADAKRMGYALYAKRAADLRR